MKATERTSEALRWLRFAGEDLREAEELAARSKSVPRHICWFAQQAAEKALKAALILEDLEVPFWHNLDALRKPPAAGLVHKAGTSRPGRTNGMGGGGPLPGGLAGGHLGRCPSRSGSGKGGLRLHRQGLRATRGEDRGRVSHSDDQPPGLGPDGAASGFGAPGPAEQGGAPGGLLRRRRLPGAGLRRPVAFGHLRVAGREGGRYQPAEFAADL